MRRLAVLAALALATPVGAQAFRDSVTVIRAARMLDVGTGNIVQNAVVTVTGDRITSITSASVPAGARVIDLGDVTLLPGLIDAHTHVTSNLEAGSYVRSATATDADLTVRGVRNLGVMLQSGFTTVRDVGSAGFAGAAVGGAAGAEQAASSAAPPVKNRASRKKVRRERRVDVLVAGCNSLINGHSSKRCVISIVGAMNGMP